MWTDSHCHLDGPEQVAEANAAGVGRLVTVGTDVETSRAAIALAAEHDGVWATAGVHPHDAASADLPALEALLTEAGVVAVGECGLDFHYDHSPRPAQRDAFAAQLELASHHDLPVVIHTREAWDETFDVLAGRLPATVVFHCFTGGPDEAERALALDARVLLSFSGIVSFKTADDIRAAAARCPSDRLLVETDSPYLAPVPHRGRPNQPAWVPLVGAAVATAKGLPVEEVEEVTTRNAERVFRLSP